MKKKKKSEYTLKHARSGINTKLSQVQTWPNQFRNNYEITIIIPEFTSICPRTGLPDFGTITIQYVPNKDCIELKSLKSYIHGFRNLGIFYENAINKILKDLVKACKPRWMKITGDFNVRGGMKSLIHVEYGKK